MDRCRSGFSLVLVRFDIADSAGGESHPMSIPAPSREIKDFIAGYLKGESADFLKKMENLGNFLYEMNRQVNLTAIKEDGFWSRHVADSLSPALFFPELFNRPHKLADLGCGAGFPSLVLAAAFPETTITSIDSTRKKIDYVNHAAEKIGLHNLTGVHGRGNELGRKEPYKGSYDAVFARAVASADILIKEALGLLKPGGSLIIYRTPNQYAEEIPFLKKWKKGFWHGTETFELPENAGTRLFLQIRLK